MKCHLDSLKLTFFFSSNQSYTGIDTKLEIIIWKQQKNKMDFGYRIGGQYSKSKKIKEVPRDSLQMQLVFKFEIDWRETG